jgi:hypothetical protein
LFPLDPPLPRRRSLDPSEQLMSHCRLYDLGQWR